MMTMEFRFCLIGVAAALGVIGFAALGRARELVGRGSEEKYELAAGCFVLSVAAFIIAIVA